MEVFLSINNNEEVVQLPVPPTEDYNIESPWGNEVHETQTQELATIGLRGLRTFSISSFFPVHEYPWSQNRTLHGMEYVQLIESWRERRIPMRLVVTYDQPHRLNINMAVIVTNFTYSSNRSGDIHYTLDLRQFAFVSTRGT